MQSKCLICNLLYKRLKRLKNSIMQFARAGADFKVIFPEHLPHMYCGQMRRRNFNYLPLMYYDLLRIENFSNFFRLQ